MPCPFQLSRTSLCGKVLSCPLRLLVLGFERHSRGESKAELGRGKSVGDDLGRGKSKEGDDELGRGRATVGLW